MWIKDLIEFSFQAQWRRGIHKRNARRQRWVEPSTKIFQTATHDEEIAADDSLDYPQAAVRSLPFWPCFSFIIGQDVASQRSDRKGSDHPRQSAQYQWHQNVPSQKLRLEVWEQDHTRFFCRLIMDLGTRAKPFQCWWALTRIPGLNTPSYIRRVWFSRMNSDCQMQSADSR